MISHGCRTDTDTLGLTDTLEVELGKEKKEIYFGIGGAYWNKTGKYLRNSMQNNT